MKSNACFSNSKANPTHNNIKKTSIASLPALPIEDNDKTHGIKNISSKSKSKKSKEIV